MLVRIFRNILFIKAVLAPRRQASVLQARNVRRLADAAQGVHLVLTRPPVVWPHTMRFNASPV
jgi:hypothetical protein